jgi:hypothetical protein
LVSILDVQEVLESDLSEGVEVYSRRVSSRAAASMLKAAKGLKLLTDNRFKQ